VRHVTPSRVILLPPLTALTSPPPPALQLLHPPPPHRRDVARLQEEGRMGSHLIGIEFERGLEDKSHEEAK